MTQPATQRRGAGLALPTLTRLVARIALLAATGCGPGHASPDSGADAPAADATDAPRDGAGDGGDAADAGTDAPDGAPDGPPPACKASHEPFAPAVDRDRLYNDWGDLGCSDGPCLCDAAATRLVEGLLECAGVEGGYFLPLGSVGFRVLGRAGGECLLEVTEESEGGVSRLECRVPLPARAWPGLEAVATTASADVLDGLRTSCTSLGSCCVLPDCPDPCEALDPPPYVCAGSAAACDGDP